MRPPFQLGQLGRGGSVATKFLPDATVKLLLHGDGANGSTTIIDSGSQGFSGPGVSGASVSNAQSVFGGTSLSFSGAGGSGVRYSSNSAFNFGAGEFLVEFFVRFNASGTNQFITGRSDATGSSGQVQFLIQRLVTTNLIQAFVVNSSGLAVIALTSSTACVANTWYYIAFGREGTTFRLFIDAAQEDSNDPGAVTIQSPLRPLGIGCFGDVSGATLNGFIDEYRITIGAYRDVASLGIPSSEFPHA